MSYYFETAGEYYSNCKLYVIRGYEVVKLQASHQRQQAVGRRGDLQSSVHFVFYNKQLTSGSPEGYSGRSNKRSVKILKYNSESVKSAVGIFSMCTLLKLLLRP